jgi:hypothetical protein
MKTHTLSNLISLVLIGVLSLFHFNCYSNTKFTQTRIRDRSPSVSLPIKILEDTDAGGTRVIDVEINNLSMTEENIEKIFSWFDQHIPNDKDLEISIYTTEESQKKSYTTYDGDWASRGASSARFKRYKNEQEKLYQVNSSSNWVNFVKKVDFTSDDSTNIDSTLNFSDSALNINIRRTKVMSLEPECEYLIISKISANQEHSAIATMHLNSKNSPQFSTMSLSKLNKKIAYFSVGWRYFLTQDNGFTWESWNARDFDTNPAIPQFNPNEFVNLQISELQFSLNGSGKMTLKNNLDQKEYKLLTTNFGKSWE